MISNKNSLFSKYPSIKFNFIDKIYFIILNVTARTLQIYLVFGFYILLEISIAVILYYLIDTPDTILNQPY